MDKTRQAAATRATWMFALFAFKGGEQGGEWCEFVVRRG